MPVSACQLAADKNAFGWVAAVAPWFRLRLPSCGPGFKSQVHLLRFLKNAFGIFFHKKKFKIGGFLYNLRLVERNLAIT